MPITIDYRHGNWSELIEIQLCRPPFPLLPVDQLPWRPTDDDELIDLDAAIVTVAPPSLPPVWARAIRALLDPENSPPLATGVWQPETIGQRGEIVVRTFVVRVPGRLSIWITAECPQVPGNALTGWVVDLYAVEVFPVGERVA